MRALKLTTFALLGMTSIAAVAMAENGTTDSAMGGGRAAAPALPRASHIVAADTRSSIAPALPVPPVGTGATPPDYLKAAHDALVAGLTGEARQGNRGRALEIIDAVAQ